MSTPGFYDAVWDRYDALDQRSPAAAHRRRLIRALARRATPYARSVLDVGCGTGLLLAELRADFPIARRVGAEPSPHALALAAARCPDALFTPGSLAGDDLTPESLGAAGGFDLVTCSVVLEHLDDDLGAVRRLRGLLSPDGRLIVTVPGDRRTRFDVAIGHRRHYRVASLRALLEAAGLEPLEAFAWGFPFHSLYRAAVRGAAALVLPRDPPATAPPALDASVSWAYAATAGMLRPLYGLNVTGYGGQLVALARRRPGVAATTS